MGIKLFLTSAVVAATVATGSGAATFNFANVADAYWDLKAGPGGKSSEGTFEQVAGSSAGAGLTNGGVTLLDAVGLHTSKPAHAFFDHDGGSGPAGLGVCSTGIRADGVSRCSSGNWGTGQKTSDDNITDGETLALTFSRAIAFVDLTIFDSKHDPANGTLLVNGAEFTVTNGTLNAVETIQKGKTFTFAFGGQAPTQAYLTAANVAPVPLPASITLLLAGLAGLFGLRRRRAAA